MHNLSLSIGNSPYPNPLKCKKYLFLKLVICIFFFNQAPQLHAQSTQRKVLGTFVLQNQVFNYEFLKQDIDNYSFKITPFLPVKKTAPSVKQDSTNGVDTTATEPDTTNTGADNEKEKEGGGESGDIFSEFSQGVFTSIFINQISNISEIDTAKKKDELKQMAVQLFVKIQTKLDFLDDEPVTANLILRTTKVTSVLKTNTSNYYDGSLSGLLAGHTVVKVKVETEDGAIKNVLVDVVKPGTSLKDGKVLTNFITFKNQYPISISSRNDPDKFADVNLYSYNCYGIKGLTRYIKLSDVLMLDITLENDKEDYSPRNSTIILTPSLPLVELKKEKRSKILEISAFTDFAGMDQEQPNGLIQIEAKRKINLNTNYYSFKPTTNTDNTLAAYDLGKYENYSPKSRKEGKVLYYVLVPKIRADKKGSGSDSVITLKNVTNIKPDTLKISVNESFGGAYWNVFGSIEPRLLFSKLEENKKFLIVDDASILQNKVAALKLFQYQLASFGFKLNLIKFVFPQPKINVNIDLGGYWFRTRVKTEAAEESAASAALNSSYISVGTSVVYRPDSRWGLSMGAAYIKQNLWNGVYKMDNNEGLTQVGADAYLKTNDDSKMFFRFKWTFDGHTFNNNFMQVQLGYSMNLFATKSEAKTD